METIILNFLTLISGGIGTFIGITKKNTWDNKGPTKTGWIAIAFLLTSLGCQFVIQWLNYQEMQGLSDSLGMEYTGWVSIGSFSPNEGWTCDKGTTQDGKCPYLIGINPKTKPEEIKTGNPKIYFISTDIAMYNRALPKEKCPPGDFIEEDFKVTLKTDWKIKILEKKIYPKCSKEGKTRVLLKVSRVL